MKPATVMKYLRDSIPLGPHPEPHNEMVSVRLDVVQALLDNAIMVGGLIGQALIEIDEIHEARPQRLAPTFHNDLRRWMDRRPFTLKDAKPRAKLASKHLREAWEIIDPSHSGEG